MKVRFLKGYPACYVKALNALIISDLHMGVEKEYRKIGVMIKPLYRKFLETLVLLISKTSASRIIILGDVKESVGMPTISESRMLRNFFSELKQQLDEVYLVKGNHDGGIESVISGVKIYSQRGFGMDEFYFLHGSAAPKKEAYSKDWLFCGHLQPSIEIEDKLGYKHRIPVWLKARLSKEKVKSRFNLSKTGKLNLIVVPAFNNMIGTLAVNKDDLSNFFFVSRNFLDIKEAEIYSLDGIYMGKIKHFV